MDERIQKIIIQQGWDDQTVKELLVQFAEEHELQNDLVEYLYEVADEENQECEFTEPDV